MIRTIFAFALAVLFFIVTLPILLLWKLLKMKWPHIWENAMFKTVQYGFRVVQLPMGIKLDVIGLNNVPSSGPCLFAGNHRSYLDVVLVYPLLPRLTGFIAKADFEKVPVLPIWMKELCCEFLIKDDIKQNFKSILNAIETVKRGKSIFIYPEGKRSTLEDETALLQFHEGSFKIAAKTGCPIIPVAVSGTRECFESQFPKIKKGHVVIEFGEPIPVSTFSREELKCLGIKTRHILESMVIKNHAAL